MLFIFLFFFNDTATTEIYTLSLHDALPILTLLPAAAASVALPLMVAARRDSVGHLATRSEEHTSELQSRQYLVCRLLLEKKKIAAGFRSRRAGAPLDTAAVSHTWIYNDWVM